VSVERGLSFEKAKQMPIHGRDVNEGFYISSQVFIVKTQCEKVRFCQFGTENTVPWTKRMAIHESADQSVGVYF